MVSTVDVENDGQFIQVVDVNPVAGMELVVVLIPHSSRVCVVVVAGLSPHAPLTSQSPPVRLIEVMVLAVAVVRDKPEALATEADMNSPTTPAAALSLVVVPVSPLELIVGAVQVKTDGVPVMAVTT